LWDEINRISGGNYLIRSDYGYTQNTTVSPELESQLGYLNSVDCNNSIGEVVNNLDEDQICELIALNPDNPTPTQAGTQQCNLESICLMKDIVINGEAAIPMEYPKGFFDCVLSNEELGDDVAEIIFLNSEVYEDFVSPAPLDLSTVVDCFSGPREENTIYTVSIHVFQPKDGSKEPWVWKDQFNYPGQIEFGHSWVSLESKTEIFLTPPNPSYNVNRRLNFGFYPAFGGKPKPLNTQTKTRIGAIFPEPVTRNAEVIRTWEIQESKFDILLSQLENFGPTKTYHLDNYNCTDFAIEFVNFIGLNVPENHGTWFNGGGSNCGDLGEDLRGMSEGELSSGGNEVQLCE